MDFDPNNLGGPQQPTHATFIPDRQPQFKLHKSIGHGKSAFQYRSNAILYEWRDGTWVELYRIENLPRKHECPTEGCSHEATGYKWVKMEYRPKKCYYCVYSKHAHTCSMCGSAVR